MIQKCIRKDLRKRKQELIGARLAEFKGLKQLGNIRAIGRKALLQSVFDKKGELQHGRKDIVDVFADFYEDLYAAREGADMLDGSWREGSCEEVSRFAIEEMVLQLKKMARNKASDDAGLVIEMVQHGSHALLQTILDIFNDIIKPVPQAPQVWRK